MKFPLDRLQVEADSLLDSFHVFYSSSSLKKNIFNNLSGYAGHYIQRLSSVILRRCLAILVGLLLLRRW